MWQRFTERARKVVFYAQEEAEQLGVSRVCTEHLLLGLTRVNGSAAARVLGRIGVPLERVRFETERLATRGDERVGEDMQLTARGKRVIDIAYKEARLLGGDHVGTEHLLLGLISDTEGVAGRVLSDLGVVLNRARAEIANVQAMPTVMEDFMAKRSTWGSFTVKAQELIALAQKEARAQASSIVSPHHLLCALLSQQNSTALQFLSASVVTPELLLEQARASSRIPVWPPQPRTGDAPSAGGMTLSTESKRVLDSAIREARVLSRGSYVGTEHLLLGLLTDGGGAATELRAAGVDAARLRALVPERRPSAWARLRSAWHGPLPSSLSAYEVAVASHRQG